uniref:Fibroblast growth factor n=1 Tax=Nothoprocta perdicaria TaxID=30464 RepID=A0A8C6YRJ7_NOTPE
CPVQTATKHRGTKRDGAQRAAVPPSAAEHPSRPPAATAPAAVASCSRGLPRAHCVRLQLSARSAGEVYIRSAASGLYLAMDPGGRLYGALPSDECLFLERLEENHYNTYVAKAHAEQRWFVGLKKDGSSKAGPRTHGGQKAILFLPLLAKS